MASDLKNLHFRDAALSDLARIVDIYNSTVASRLVTADTVPVSVASRRAWFDAHKPDGRPLWVITDGGEDILGWVSFQSFYGRPAYSGTVEVSIYVDAAHRGAGIGRAALQYAIDRAPALNIKVLLGFIFAHNTPSLRLFLSFGFEEWAHLPGVAVLDGVERGLKILGRRVG